METFIATMLLFALIGSFAYPPLGIAVIIVFILVMGANSQ